MHDSSKRVPFRWIIALLAVVLIGALPAAWAGPLAQPVAQTIPNPDPTPTPKLVVCTLLEPCKSATETIAVKNGGTLPMEGCVLRLTQVAGIDYLVNGAVIAAPFTIAIPRLLPGEQSDVKVDIRLKCEDPAVVPCLKYTTGAYLECGSTSTLLDEFCIESPCPILPSVGK
jgi:hypothetical protein